MILQSTMFIALSLFLNHHHCFFILIYGLRETGALNISNIGLGFGDHSIDLCRKLVGWFLFGIYRFCLVVFPRFLHDCINNNGHNLKEFKNVFTMNLVIIKCLFYLEITYENKKKIQLKYNILYSMTILLCKQVVL